jgi:SAM-dependent methyltransferase
MAWDGDEYQARFDRLAASGASLHGEADLVAGWAPTSVLDAGCGTGRVAIELHRRGIDVVGVDVDESMLATARQRAPEQTWICCDLAALDIDRTFDVVVMAGNVPLFTQPGTQAALVAGVARCVGEGGVLVAGFSLGRGYSVAEYDRDAAAAGLVVHERWATWGRTPFEATSDYAVSVHRRGSATQRSSDSAAAPP